MASPDIDKSDPAMSLDLGAELAKYGITRVPVDYFHFRGFRYTNLKDAIAEAKRHQDGD